MLDDKANCNPAEDDSIQISDCQYYDEEDEEKCEYSLFTEI